jgi:pSer/pThr/pTyr-binding forkhead associated (FHA) protein
MDSFVLVDHANNVHSVKKLLSIGRDSKEQVISELNGLEVAIDDTRVSHKHCSIIFDEWKRQYMLVNHSKNGTFVNDVLLLDEAHLLHNDDRIVLNKKNPNTTFTFKNRGLAH